MTKSKWQAADSDVRAIVAGRHSDPFGILGLHEVDGAWVARTFIPHAESVSARTMDNRILGELEPRGDGFFEGIVKLTKLQPVNYHARNEGGEWNVLDPYSFGPVLGPM
ncbi:MAG: 1,4-alpha-glucan branching enzyme, partial [Devosia sp.]|nr:1,4-alpha-glucan branching enzyme [Devosia sp.]